MAFDSCGGEGRGARPLRVALFSGNYNYTADGANRALNRLVGYLEDREGALVRVYSPTSPTPAFPPRGELVSAPALRAPFRPDYRIALGLSPRLARDVEAFRPDIVHLSSPDPLGFAAQRLARRLGAPVVASLHTLFETYLAYYGVGWLTSAVSARLNAFYSACDYVLAPTPALARDLAAGGLGPRARVWSRGVDADAFSPAARCLEWRRAQGFGDDQPVLVYFGRVVLEKGVAVFADAVEAVRTARPDVGVLIVGEGPARPWFQERLPQAVFTGHLSGAALNRAVASGDILVNPSCTESFCNVTLEAMASGLAVVCADAPNHRSLVPEGAGRLCGAADPGAFAGAVLEVLGDRAARRALARAARTEALRYDWDQILSGVAEIYREALEAAGTGRLNKAAIASKAAPTAPTTPASGFWPGLRRLIA
jgi:glycosyltransferase involved in cell wall biosynthesis